jgi:N-acetylglutamate synthase-like GNAT family acetyltransferase
MANQMGAYALRPAEGSDAAQVADLVDAAYRHYVERIGMLPGPMTEDYAGVIRGARVTVAERDGMIVGVIVLNVTEEGFVIENVAVAPPERGRGLGRRLLEFAEDEARHAGFTSVYLYTHEKMTENQALYSKVGYLEYDRRSQGDFSLVYMRKRLGSG